MVEDAISGVQAGVKGNFGLVLGAARKGNERELKPGTKQKVEHLLLNEIGFSPDQFR